MRIGFFTDSYLPKIDGIVFSIESFRAELEAQGHEVYIFAPSPTLRHKEKSDHVIRFPAFKGLFFEDYPTSVFFPPQAIQKIKQYNLDIIHYHTPGQIGLLGAYFALRSKTPLVTTYHTDLYEYVSHYPNVLPGSLALSLLAPFITQGGLSDFRTAFSNIKPERNVEAWNKKIVMRGMTMLHNYCDRVIAPSRKIEKMLLQWGTKSGVRVLPTGVDPIPTTPEKIEKFRKKHRIEKNDRIIISVGRLGSEKNFDMLITAFNMIVLQNPNAKLLLIGEHEYRAKLEARAADLDVADRVIFTGYIKHNDIGAAYAAAHLFAFPSTTDTQGLVLHEAAAAGLPIVMVDHEITEVVQDKVNGLFARNGAKDLARKMNHILSNEKLRTEMSEKSAALAGKYSAHNQAERLLHLYQNILDGHAKAKKKPQRRFRLPELPY